MINPTPTPARADIKTTPTNPSDESDDRSTEICPPHIQKLFEQKANIQITGTIGFYIFVIMNSNNSFAPGRQMAPLNFISISRIRISTNKTGTVRQ